VLKPSALHDTALSAPFIALQQGNARQGDSEPKGKVLLQAQFFGA